MPHYHVHTSGESDTGAKLINLALYICGWTEVHIRREETAGAVELGNGKPRRKSKGRVDYMERSNSGGSWAVNIVKLKAKAKKEAAPLHKQAKEKQQAANQWNDDLKERKKAKPKDEAAIAEATAKAKALTKESRELKAKAENIENAVYDLKAVNPNKKVVEDTRTPAQLIKIIEDEGKKIAKALTKLKGVTK